MKINIMLLIIFTLTIARCSTSSNPPQKLILAPGEIFINGKYTPLEYNPNSSLTYNKPYSDLKDELLYALIATGDDSNGRNTICLIVDKDIFNSNCSRI